MRHKSGASSRSGTVSARAVATRALSSKLNVLFWARPLFMRTDVFAF
jgi:hypothetical protein